MLRIAAISYLNSRPYFYPFTSGALDGSGFRFDFMVPAEANRALIEGTHDAGLISLAAWLKGRDRPGLVRVPGLEIAAFGPAGSILLFAVCPWNEIRRIAVTTESATSVELVRVLGKLDGIEFALEPALDPLAELSCGRCDAALLIGDAALAANPDGLEVHDLGEIWRARTGRPMVYAVFVLRAEHADRVAEAGKAFHDALSWSRNHISALGAHPSPLPGISVADYLRRFDKARARADLDDSIDYFASLLT